MNTKYLMIPALLIMLVVVVSASEDFLTVRMSNVPLEIVLLDYAEKAGKSVEVVKNIHGAFTITSIRELTLYEYLALIESELTKANIGLFPISTNRLVATWIKVPKSQTRTMNPQQSEYQVRRHRRLEEMRQRQMDLIRQGRKPLPMIPLSQEMDDQLVKEGIFPPVNSSTNSQRKLK